MLNSDFGRYAFPQKLYEILACQVPVIVAAVGAMRELLLAFPEFLYEPENIGELSNRLKAQLASPSVPTITVPDWTDQTILLEKILRGPLE
jgi:glycosyltransferase involved in cell wall biosynthesis